MLTRRNLEGIDQDPRCKNLSVSLKTLPRKTQWDKTLVKEKECRDKTLIQLFG
jgi:hypothetical protein